MNKNDKLNLAFNKLKDHFHSNFHTALWHSLIDPAIKGLWCYAENTTAQGPRLVIAEANQPGNIRTPAFFKSNDHEERRLVLMELNQIALGLSEETCDLITISSMGPMNDAPDPDKPKADYTTWLIQLLTIITGDKEGGDLSVGQIALNHKEVIGYYNEDLTPEEVYLDKWYKDAGNFFAV